MKKLVITLAVIVIATTSAIQAQSTIDHLYEKYAGQKGFTSINISPEMFGFLSSLDMSDSSEKAKETQNVLDQLSGLKMLVYEPDGSSNQDFLDEVKSLSKSKGFSEIMSVDSEDEAVKFLAKKGKDDKVLEFLMIVFDDNKKEAVVMSMTGNLDMKTISEISKSLDLEGMENIDKLDDK
jgi:hypothetical protein